MSYEEWFYTHAQKHKSIVDRLVSLGYDQQGIIEYFRWDNIKETDRDFCPLFAQDKKCHDMDELNCYFCACPHFRFDDNAPRLKSSCSIDSKNGKQITYNDTIHQDCSLCHLPHKAKIIEKYFDTDWLRIMSKCNQTSLSA